VVVGAILKASTNPKIYINTLKTVPIIPREYPCQKPYAKKAIKPMSMGMWKMPGT
jgi:hypothetical protein